MNEMCEWTHPRGVIQDGVATKRALQEAEDDTAGGGGRPVGGGGGIGDGGGDGDGNDNGGGDAAASASGGGDVAPADGGDSKITVHGAPADCEGSWREAARRFGAGLEDQAYVDLGAGGC